MATRMQMRSLDELGSRPELAITAVEYGFRPRRTSSRSFVLYGLLFDETVRVGSIVKSSQFSGVFVVAKIDNTGATIVQEKKRGVTTEIERVPLTTLRLATDDEIKAAGQATPAPGSSNQRKLTTAAKVGGAVVGLVALKLLFWP